MSLDLTSKSCKELQTLFDGVLEVRRLEESERDQFKRRLKPLEAEHKIKFRKLVEARATADGISLGSNVVGAIKHPVAQGVGGAGSVTSAILSAQIPQLERAVQSIELQIQRLKEKIQNKENLISGYARQLDKIGQQMSNQGCPAIYRY